MHIDKEYRYPHAYGQLVGLFEILARAARSAAGSDLRAQVFEACAKAMEIKREMDEFNQKELNTRPQP